MDKDFDVFMGPGPLFLDNKVRRMGKYRLIGNRFACAMPEPEKDDEDDQPEDEAVND